MVIRSPSIKHVLISMMMVVFVHSAEASTRSLKRENDDSKPSTDHDTSITVISCRASSHGSFDISSVMIRGLRYVLDSCCHENIRTTIGHHIPTNTYNRIMGDDSVSSEDTPPLQDVLDALDDPECRAILRETVEPMTANELIDVCDIPRSTLYRKLELLSSASLVRERDTINPGGGRVTHYERSFDDVTISMDDTGEFSVSVERPPQSTDERLADIWSMMGDEV